MCIQVEREAWERLGDHRSSSGPQCLVCQRPLPTDEGHVQHRCVSETLVCTNFQYESELG